MWILCSYHFTTPVLYMLVFSAVVRINVEHIVTLSNLLALMWWIQIKDTIENAMKHLSVGTFFSKPSSICRSEEDVNNNVSARLAAHVAGFTQEHHSVVCAACDNSQHCARSPLCLEQGGLFFSAITCYLLSTKQKWSCLLGGQ